MWAIAAAFVLAVSLAEAGETELERKLLPGRTHCLDGTPAGYYHSPINNHTTTWVIYLMGGGSCVTEEACKARADTILGSSKDWPELLNMSGNLLDGDCSVNSVFCDANRVFVPYGTGDVHIGGRTSASPETWGLYFTGHTNLAAILDDLDTAYGFSRSATSVLLSGDSAGGIGTFLNADYVGSRFGGRDVKYRAAPQGGWFFPNVTLFPAWVNGSWMPPYNPDSTVLWNVTGTLSAECQQEYGRNAFRCLTMDQSYRYIRTPLLVGENSVDSQQLYGELLVPTNPPSGVVQKEVASFVDWFQGRMLQSIAQVGKAVASGVKPLDGVWMPACFDHVGDIDFVHPQLTVQGITYKQAVESWWSQAPSATPGNSRSTQIAIAQCALDDPEGGPCSLHCDHQPPPPGEAASRGLSAADLSEIQMMM